MNVAKRTNDDSAGDGLPLNEAPLFGRWRNAYLLVVLVFILEVAFFYFVSHYFS